MDHSGFLQSPSKLDPQTVRQFFYLSQIAVGVLFAFLFLRSQSKNRDGGFKSYGGNPRAGGAKPRVSSPSEDPLANARMRPQEPLRLAGLSVHGQAHEILGVSALASSEEIQRAYRELMKRYHPDRVGRPGSREWDDAQGIAEALNRAKEELLKRAKNRERGIS